MKNCTRWYTWILLAVVHFDKNTQFLWDCEHLSMRNYLDYSIGKSTNRSEIFFWWILTSYKLKFVHSFWSYANSKRSGSPTFSTKVRAKLGNETLRSAHKKNFRQVGALNCNAFGILLCYASLNVHASRDFFENKHFCTKFRALSRGAIIFLLSLRV